VADDRGNVYVNGAGSDRTTLFVTAAEWRGMTESEMVTPGSGQVLAVRVDVPGAGRPCRPITREQR
jgi:sugar lactone lactonase YvrE